MIEAAHLDLSGPSTSPNASGMFTRRSSLTTSRHALPADVAEAVNMTEPDPEVVAEGIIALSVFKEDISCHLTAKWAEE
jgi:hypothetical protein